MLRLVSRQRVVLLLCNVFYIHWLLCSMTVPLFSPPPLDHCWCTDGPARWSLGKKVSQNCIVLFYAMCNILTSHLGSVTCLLIFHQIAHHWQCADFCAKTSLHECSLLDVGIFFLYNASCDHWFSCSMAVVPIFCACFGYVSCENKRKR